MWGEVLITSSVIFGTEEEVTCIPISCMVCTSLFFCSRLHLSMGQRCLTAWVQHTYGKIVISASTRERCIAHFLYSLTTVNAARNLGRIIAQRCKHMGISNVAWTRNYHYRRSPTRKYHRVDAFERGLRGAGIQLFEKKLRMRPPTKPYRVVSHYRGPPIKRAIDWNILR